MASALVARDLDTLRQPTDSSVVAARAALADLRPGAARSRRPVRYAASSSSPGKKDPVPARGASTVTGTTADGASADTGSVPTAQVSVGGSSGTISSTA